MSELTPYICVADSRAAIEWYAAALGAEVVVDPIVMDDGRVGHCELAVDGARWTMSDEFESAGVAPPDPARATPSAFISPSPTATRPPPGCSSTASPSTAAPRTAHRPAGSRCSTTRSATAGSSTSGSRHERER